MKAASGIDWGDLCRSAPFSDHYGGERGLPVDRVYMIDFLRAHIDAVRGRVLEVESEMWTKGLEPAGVTSVEVIDIDADNPKATIVADLCDPQALDADSFDCVIIMQTIQYLADPAAAFAGIWKALASGGTVLVSSPVISRLDFICGPEGDRCRFTASGLRSLAEATMPGATVTAENFGSLATAIAFLAGIPADDMSSTALSWSDHRLPIVACARIDKP